MEEPYLLPPPINNLVGKTFLFKIGIERENYLYKHEIYKVLKIISDTQMITEFVGATTPTVCLIIRMLNFELLNTSDGFQLIILLRVLVGE